MQLSDKRQYLIKAIDRREITSFKPALVAQR